MVLSVFNRFEQTQISVQKKNNSGTLLAVIVGSYSTAMTMRTITSYHQPRPVRLAYQPPASSTFLSEQTSHQQPANSTFLSEQTSISHQQPADF
jgi:hypothetical protein